MRGLSWAPPSLLATTIAFNFEHARTYRCRRRGRFQKDSFSSCWTGSFNCLSSIISDMLFTYQISKYSKAGNATCKI
ncbi:hypothetical protein LOK49_LG07G02494 [Camellia lanceoleosa]|uniref:Uncharacterized protein n=1 Tax=Camellia lanceoleosa TaxID=1840588 RepID=A0ACC0H387_9ERIC|nr:hypothetical protein LOK49_LG07G02494 [Camellia lanceoleosa]